MKKCEASLEYSGEYIRDSDTFVKFGNPYDSFQCVLCSENGFSETEEVFGKEIKAPKKLRKFLTKKNSEDDSNIKKINVDIDGPEIYELENKTNKINKINISDKEFIESSLGIWIHLKVPNIQKDVLRNIEGVVEKKTGDLISEIKGITHDNLRDEIVIKIRQYEVENGIDLKSIGYCLGEMILNEYTFAESVDLRFVTDLNSAKEELKFARYIYDKRDEATKLLNDENVSKFYLCRMCQSATPEHVCIITPDRPSVCGTIQWQEAQAFETVNPDGPISGFEKGKVINGEKGEYGGINKAISLETKDRIRKLNLYTLYENPHTTGACVEIVAFAIPELNGFGLIDRMSDFPSINGLTFEELKATVSGGIQVPGFMGIGELYMYSPNFFKKESGWSNVVWITSSLKEKVIRKIEDLKTKEIIKFIATENDAKNLDELKVYYNEDTETKAETNKNNISNLSDFKIEFLNVPIIENSEKGNVKIKIPNVKILKRRNGKL